MKGYLLINLMNFQEIFIFSDKNSMVSTMSFSIKIKVVGGLSDRQISAFEIAAKRWEKIITSDLPRGIVPSGPFEGEEIKDLAITAEGKFIDGSSGVLGQAGPVFIRRDSKLPITGLMEFDIDDLRNMENDGTLEGVITHEMGHVLGLGTLWETLGLVQRLNTNDPIYIGNKAMQEYANLRSSKSLVGIPVANTGSSGTFGGHWRETTFDRELMTGFVDQGGMPLSRMTVAALSDMGYTVNMEAADPYELPISAFSAITRSHSCRTSGRILRPVRWYTDQ